MAALMAALSKLDPSQPEAGPSNPAKRKKIPKVAVYVSGAAVRPLLVRCHM